MPANSYCIYFSYFTVWGFLWQEDILVDTIPFMAFHGVLSYSLLKNQIGY